MRKFLLASLLLAGAVTTANLVFAGDWTAFPNGREPLYHSSHQAISKYSMSLKGQSTYGDTTYVGYSPGQGSAANPWSIRASVTTPATTNVHRPPNAGCMWNWDPAEAGGNGYINGDSLQGWWPVRMPWRFELDTSQPDYNLPGCGLDFGNLTNYYPIGTQHRTFGVVGVWHRDQGGDPTGTGTSLSGQPSDGVTWVPLQGQQSAWCGLRAHADANAPVDGITHNPYTADAAMFNMHYRFSAPIAAPKFPGYVDQWDQMLYKDIDMTSNTSGDLSLHFVFSTRMSLTADFCGWFDKDPLTVTSDGTVNCAAGNYISEWDTGYTGPVDSFMVYVGQPVEGTFQPFNGTCSAASGRLPIFDPLRRWFDEVVEANTAGRVIELVSVAGNDSADARNITIPNAQLASILSASAGKVRLVFRVKTNSQVSDNTNTAYNSRGRGAAQVDNVTYSISGGASSPAGWGDFEAAGSIDNTQLATAAWRSTGKPPHELAHVARLGDPGVPYDDICGSDPAAVGRVCSMSGGIITFGDNDLGDAIGNPVPYTGDHEQAQTIMSPTIQLRSNNGSWPNTIGIQAPGNQGDAVATSDYEVDYELFAKAATANAPPVGTGIVYRWMFQGYPVLSTGSAWTAGKPMWGDLVRSGANYQTDAICFRSLPGITGQEGSMLANMAMWQFASGASENPAYPDSMRIGWEEESICWDAGVNACDPIGGLYVDNVSLVILDGTPLPVNAEIWNFYQSSFPWNEAVTPAFAASFDTAGIQVKSGLDTGPPNGLSTFDVPGDSIVATAIPANPALPMRMDLVFRILPGPGNYRIVGNAASGLTTNPSAGTPTTGVGRPAVVPNVASTNFWESYLGNNGPFGTVGGHPGGVWDPNVWNSARCDTAEANLFPRTIPAQTFTWQGTYIDYEVGLGPGDSYVGSTVQRTGLGLPRHKCFLASNTAAPTDIDCIHDPPAVGTGYDLTWVTAVGSGYDGNPTTVEGTKIIPDGLLTPGAHVEYFWRKAENGSTAMTGMLPDTTTVVPQIGERNNDGHRFAGFGALPDRWKQAGYTHPVLGAVSGNPACMLVVNDQTTNGYDWACWSGVADTIGATAQQKWGAEVGWHAVGGGADINNPANNLDGFGHVGTFPRVHLGNPGTTWDGYQIIGAEDTGPAGSFGARYAFSDASNTQINDKRQQGAPTLEQLKAFYKIILWFTGNLNAYVMGPDGDRSSDDEQLLKDWFVSGNPASLNRVFWAMGDGFVEGNEKESPTTGQPDLDLNYLGVALVNGNYRLAGGVLGTTIDLTPNAGSLIADGTVYGVRNTCTHTDDVLGVGIGAVQPFTTVWTNYQPNPSLPSVTFPSGIYKAFDATKPWVSITEGFSIMDLMNRFGSDTRGRDKYFFNVLTALVHKYTGLCPTVGTPVVPLDVPNVSEGNQFADFVNLRNNPLSSGMARIHFGLAKDDRVTIKVYDVTGREIRTLADRSFTAGEHDIVWDGSNNAGRPVARGVYFTQVRYRNGGFNDSKKLTVLK